MTLTALHLVILATAAAILIAAAVNDARVRLIPNVLNGLLLLLFPAMVVTAPHTIQWAQNAVLMAAVLLCGYTLYALRLFGAGDVKLLAIASLWAGPPLIASFLMVTALAGGVVSIAVLAIALIKQRKAAEKSNLTPLFKTPVPYGIALASGGLIVLGKLAQPILLPG